MCYKINIEMVEHNIQYEKYKMLYYMYLPTKLAI